ncbi:CinA family protein [Sphingobacterium paucimobilis]|uniref:CinA C-terminal domain-containing protein n=1 Tax=Sphingobacterium paucimobilis HER1398 TaxID=1346330 RepID=U2IX55_9SPHI|nr:CinA family protein [Sphingobacterium paucimobilis]ERJ57284.1 hypothetical protein M472_00745 [Sphingobacterium paucimobilis HER1398]
MEKQINEQILRHCGKLLVSNDLKLSCVESMSSGFLSAVIAMEVNSGDYYLGSVVCYDNIVKEKLLGVSTSKINKYCAESAVVTLRILDGLSKLMPQKSVYVSVTGLAYETDNPKQRRPIGTVYYAFALGDEKVIFKKKFSGTAAEIILATCNSLLSDLRQWLGALAEVRTKE